MNNEPVAYAIFKDGEFFDAIHPDEHSKYEGMYTTPLYTHPAELTDEEKWELFTNLARSPDLRTDMIRLADSILRKAQEK